LTAPKWREADPPRHQLSLKTALERDGFTSDRYCERSEAMTIQVIATTDTLTEKGQCLATSALSKPIHPKIRRPLKGHPETSGSL
jgi:hypothetical protein